MSGALFPNEFVRRQSCEEPDRTREDRLADLLERWEIAVSSGRRPTPQEFCRNTPEDLPGFVKLLKQLGAAGLMTQSSPEVDHSNPTNFRAGRYTAYEYHAEGGLGVVYRAKDEELNRTVALKCMKAAGTVSSPAGQQFLLEAQITSQLDHPGIAPVHGRGRMDDGRPFYAMRFVEGETLQDAIRRYHATSSRDQGLELRRLLRSFVGMCQTIGFAHSRNVIHRDLKPSNVMVGKFGEVLVMDWGLAKEVSVVPHNEVQPARTLVPTANDGGWPSPQCGSIHPATLTQKDRSQAHDDTPIGHDGTPKVEVTVYGRAKGSPSFMSPEQARGEWDRVRAASDIYSSGSTLYYLLTGKAPYEGVTSVEVVERVRRGIFPPPKQVDARVPSALDAVCRKAMAFHPGDRYANATALAEDVERWLADEPVSAWREPLTLRARRWAKRHRTLMTASASVVLVGLAILAIYGYRLDRKNDELRVQRNRAEFRFQNALESNSHLVEEIQAKLIRSPGTRELRETLLRDSILRLDKLLQDADQTRDVNRVTIKARLQLGNLYLEVEQSPTKAVLQYHLASDLANALRSQDPDDSATLMLIVEAHQRLGRAYTELGQFSRSEELYRDANRILETVGADGDEARAEVLSGNAELLLETGDTTGAMVQLAQARAIAERLIKHGIHAESSDFLAKTILAQAHSAMRAGQFSQALEFLNSSLEKWMALQHVRPSDVTIQRQLAVVHSGLAAAHHELGHRSEAHKHTQMQFQQAKRLVDQDGENGANLLQLAGAYGNLALDCGQRFELKLAEENLAESNRLVEKVARLDSSNLTTRRQYSHALHQLAMNAKNLRKHKVAANRLNEAVLLDREILIRAPDHSACRADLAERLKEVGVLYLEYLPEKDTGFSSLAESVAIWKTLVDDDPKNVAWRVRSIESCRLLAYWQRTARKAYDQSALLLRAGIASADQLRSGDRAIPLVRKTIGLLTLEGAELSFATSRSSEGFTVLRTDVQSSGHRPKDSITFDLLGRNHKLQFDQYLKSKMPGQAKEALQKAVDSVRQGLNETPETAELRAQLQTYLAIQADQVLYEDPHESLKLLKQALKLSPRFPHDLAELANQLRTFATLEMRAGDCAEMLNRPKEALDHYVKVLETHEKIFKLEPESPGNPGMLAYDHRRIAEIRQYLLDFQGSLKNYEKAREIIDHLNSAKKPLITDAATTDRLLRDNLPFAKSLPVSIKTIEATLKQPISIRMNALRIRISWLIQAERFDEAIETANRMTDQKTPRRGDNFALAAVEFGRLSTVHKGKFKEHAARALELLDHAKKAGYFQGPDDIAWLKWETFFDNVRGLAGFADLLRELEGKELRSQGINHE